MKVMIVLMLVLASTAQAQLDAPDVPDVPDATGDAAGDAETAVADAAGNASVVSDNGTITIEGNASAHAGRHVEWTFDLPLRGDSWRFRGDAERETVQITTTWASGDEARDWPGTPTLHLRTGSHEIHRDADAIDASSADFTVTHDELVRGEATGWWLTLHVHGDTDWTSGYDGNRSSIALPAPGASVTVHSTVWAYDSDGDGRADDIDNCPDDANADQANMDGDVHGDACDADIDGDGWSNDAESDAGSDARDRASTPLDRDGDGYNNTAEENATSDPDDPASTPEDPDADGHNNTVEAEAQSDPHDPASTPMDPDADGLEDDNCPHDANPDQADGDGDGIGDACDTRPDDGPTGDHDGDGFQNRDDNCPRAPNADQANLDGDRQGDACDRDMDGDGHNNWEDAFYQDGTEWADNDGDGVGDNADEDDDNDGLSDGAERAGGTDPLVADTDGDRYSDLDELRMGSDATDPHDPPYLPTDVRAVGRSDGSVRITWNGTGDARIAGYTVWTVEDVRVVARTDGDSAVDSDFPGGAATYAVQVRFHDDDGGLRPDEAVMTSIFAEDVIVWQQQAAGDSPQPGESAGSGQEPAPDMDTPATGILLVLGAIFLFARRQR